ncbi:MAG: phosphoribosylglycinamide formyltransferase [Xanthomonadales bacterium]|nr:phosphoribosylglycinamide formyltransferase [Xanthomonadales bacterium]
MSPAASLRVAVLISGSGTNLQAIIDANAGGNLGIDIIGVISNRPDALGLQRARDADIPAIAIDFAACANRAHYDKQLAQELSKLAPDLVVLAGYMRILPTATVNQFRGRMLNIHPSLLPAYPGLDTYTRALAAGEAWHGSTVHFVTPEVDAGPGILQYRLRIRADETEPTLRARVQNGEYNIYPQAIAWFAASKIKLQDNTVIMDGKPVDGPAVIDEEC